MPILSIPGPMVAFIAFGRAQIWRIVLLLGLIFSPFAAMGMCSDFVVNPPEGRRLLEATRYIDLDKLAHSPKENLTALKALYLGKQLELESQVDDLERRSQKNVEPQDFGDLSGRLALRRGELQRVHEYIDLLERMSMPRFKLPSTDSLQRFSVNRHSDDTEAMAEIVTNLKSLAKDESHLLVRFIPIARVDLALEHGTDLYGQPFSNRGKTDITDFMFREREDILKANNLKMHDGFEALTIDEAQNFVVANPTAPPDVKRVFAPHSDFQKFMNGEMAIAIYDATQLDDCDDTGFYVFKNTSERRKALLTVITPVKG